MPWGSGIVWAQPVCVSSSCTPRTPGAKLPPGVCTPGELSAGRGNGQHDPVHGILSINLTLLPLSFVEWMGLEQLPEKGISQCSIPWEEGGGFPTCGCSPACLCRGGVDKRHPSLQPWELLVFGHPALIPSRSLYHPRRKPKSSGLLLGWKEREAWKGRESRGKTLSKKKINPLSSSEQTLY